MPNMETTFGGWPAISMLVMSLAGYVFQSQITQHVQDDLGYRQPYFIFYIAHSSFLIIFPIHVMLLSWYTKIPAISYLSGLQIALTNHLEPTIRSSSPPQFPTARFLTRVVLLTFSLAIPGLMWYIAVSLTSLSDVTAILNCNAMWAYVITVFVTGERWLLHRVLSVAIAILGVLLIVYGGSPSAPGTQVPSRGPFTSKDIIGDVLSLIASVGFAISEVAYKIYIALPIEQEAEKPVLSLPTYERIVDPDSPTIRTEHIPSLSTRARTSSFASLVASSTETTQSQYTPVEPAFGLHPNLITSCVGVCGLLVLWIPIPILHYFNVERWQLPPDGQTWIEVILLSICGCASNGGFMILLALWGPVLVSVANLLTIVLVLISDTLFGHARDRVTLAGLFGAAMIIGAFGILAAETVSNDRHGKEQVLDEDEDE